MGQFLLIFREGFDIMGWIMDYYAVFSLNYKGETRYACVRKRGHLIRLASQATLPLKGKARADSRGRLSLQGKSICFARQNSIWIPKKESRYVS